MSTPWFYTASEPVFRMVMQDTVKGFDLKEIQSEVSSFKEKAEFIVASLKTTSEPYIVFSFSDAIVKDTFSDELSQMKDDMIFLEGSKGELQMHLLYLKNSPRVLEFWNSLTDTTLEDNLKGFKGPWSKFSKKCLTTDIWDKIAEFDILVLIPSGFGKEFDFAEKIFRMAQYVDFQEYMQYVPENIVPFIYKIQELLFLTHKQMKSELI